MEINQTARMHMVVLDELFEDPLLEENERMIRVILEAASTPVDVVNQILNRYEEILNELTHILQDEK